MKVVRRLYDWVLSWADTPYGVPALFLLAFAEASFFPIPPDVLLIALCLAIPTRSYRFALVATIGSATGGMLGYLIGWGAWDSLSPYFYQYVPGFTEAGFAQVKGLFDQYDFWTIFAAGFTPIPYKIFTISAGAFQINLPVFALASVVSRGLRFFLIAALFYYLGRPARDFIEKYFNLLTILFLVLLVAVLVLIKYLH
ncbi:membrane protein YqaA, SNARE-associated domain [Malonomonas rubra DSM 5091]|uniref:Membrane protein YqaA, SNARE-associated domain n=1 Tax=Malonomonas rubra DSM 5091 TaxID=1122189 RepID=A0A1M6DC70_MALRU|nr:YqaA family protein [Malonomonas rubra]SHI70671.1 membrane protein YqaA, SNARE-associated domain [Malonomonas rubra DSM 5091]